MEFVNEPALGASEPGARFPALLFVLFTVDMLFLPMFHVAGVPYKPSYLLLLLYVPTALTIRPARTLVAACWALAAICVLGGLFLTVLDEGAVIGETLRNCLIWVLAPLAFAFGWRQRTRLDFLFVALPAYVLLNVVLTIGYAQLPWLVRFYGLESWVASRLFDLRSPGIHFNANLSAFAGNLLFLGIVVGQASHRVTVTSVSTRWGVVLMLVVLHLMLGSRGEALAAMILGVAWLYYLNRDLGYRLARFAAITVLAAGLLAVTVVPAVRYLAARSTSVAFVERQFTSSLTIATSAQITDPTARLNSVILRPFVGADRVAARFMRSPLWGTGFDTADTYPFDKTYFHNDWAVVLVAGGLAGILLFLVLIRQLSYLGVAALVPFFLTAPVNSFILAPQHVMFYFAIMGCVAQSRWSPDSRVSPGAARLEAP